MAKIDLTAEEQAAIRDLRALERRWPKSLWLFSASGSLCVMRSGANGEFVKTSDGGNDHAYVVATIKIPNDGGDW